MNGNLVITMLGAAKIMVVPHGECSALDVLHRRHIDIRQDRFRATYTTDQKAGCLRLIAHSAETEVRGPGPVGMTGQRRRRPVIVTLAVRKRGEIDCEIRVGDVGERAQLLDVRHTPVLQAGQRHILCMNESLFPRHLRGRPHLLPGQVRKKIGDGTVIVVYPAQRRLGGLSSHAACMDAFVSAGLRRFALAMCSNASSFIDHPDATGIISPGFARPPVLCAGRRKVGGIQGGIVLAMIQDTKEFVTCREPPVLVTGQVEKVGVGDRIGPAHGTSVHLLPE